MCNVDDVFFNLFFIYFRSAQHLPISFYQEETGVRLILDDILAIKYRHLFYLYIYQESMVRNLLLLSLSLNAEYLEEETSISRTAGG